MAIETSALLVLALALLTVPLNWLAAFFTAAMVHELGHYLALRALGGRAGGFALGPFGAVLTVSALSPGREALCALAGPLAGALLVSLYHPFPRLALCAAVHSGFNLLPIRPLDGGRVVYGLLRLICRESTARKLQTATEIAVCCLLPAVFGCMKPGIVGIGFALAVIARAFFRKIPCKVRRGGVL